MALKQLSKAVKKKQEFTDKEINSFLKELKRFLDNALEEIVGEIEDGNVDPALALGKILTEIKKRGLTKQLGELTAIYGSELRKVKQTLKEYGLSANLQELNTDTVTALIKFKVNDIENKSLEVIGSLRPVILEQTILGQKIDLSALRDRVESKLFNSVKTELNTAMLSFNRLVTATQAERLGVEKFIYIGPDDKVTRPFCQQLLEGRSPPIYTLKEIMGMDNEQGMDVLTAGGGYNCRHQWGPVSDEFAKELGFDDGSQDNE